MTTNRWPTMLATIGLLALGDPCPANVVHDWNDITLNTIKATNTNPPMASRALAMVHCAIYDAVNARDKKYVPFQWVAAPPPGYSLDAAAAAAAHRVLASLYPAQQSAFNAALAQSLAGIPTGPKNKGISFGKACGEMVLAARANDGSAVASPYMPLNLPGFWQPTPPAFAPALLPNWATVACWTMSSPSQFRCPGPPALVAEAYAIALDEVRDLGRIDSAVRTADQTQIARFWADGAGTVTPPGHWNRIAGDLSRTQGLSLVNTARMYAMLNCAMADAAIACWDSKYAFNFWRPITAIVHADTDRNPSTLADASWLPLIPTPPFPTYSSGHSTFSGAAARVLAHVLGADAVEFSTTSDGLPGVTRSFHSLDAAAEEAAASRLYGGIHFRFDNLDGLLAGRQIAAHVLANSFSLVGDLNGDGHVTLTDLHALLGMIGRCPASGACAGDLNRDGIVNGADVALLAQRMGS